MHSLCSFYFITLVNLQNNNLIILFECWEFRVMPTKNCVSNSNCHGLDFIAVFSVTVYKGELTECYSVDNYSLEILL